MNLHFLTSTQLVITSILNVCSRKEHAHGCYFGVQSKQEPKVNWFEYRELKQTNPHCVGCREKSETPKPIIIVLQMLIRYTEKGKSQDFIWYLVHSVWSCYVLMRYKGWWEPVLQINGAQTLIKDLIKRGLSGYNHSVIARFSGEWGRIKCPRHHRIKLIYCALSIGCKYYILYMRQNAKVVHREKKRKLERQPSFMLDMNRYYENIGLLEQEISKCFAARDGFNRQRHYTDPLRFILKPECNYAFIKLIGYVCKIVFWLFFFF